MGGVSGERGKIGKMEMRLREWIDHRAAAAAHENAFEGEERAARLRSPNKGIFLHRFHSRKDNTIGRNAPNIEAPTGIEAQAPFINVAGEVVGGGEAEDRALVDIQRAIVHR